MKDGKSPGLVKNALDRDQRLTTCTDCKYGIFVNHNKVWTNRGLVHQECEDKRLLNEIKNVTSALPK